MNTAVDKKAAPDYNICVSETADGTRAAPPLLPASGHDKEERTLSPAESRNHIKCQKTRHTYSAR